MSRHAEVGFISSVPFNANWTPSAVIDQRTGNAVAEMNVTTNGAITVKPPVGLGPGQRLTLRFINTSGGAMGTITWDPVYHLAGAFVAPANNNRRSIDFIYDGTTLHESGRNTADVAN